MSVHFMYFYLNEEELNQLVCLIKYVKKYVDNEISTFHKINDREEQKQNPSSKTSFLKLLKKLYTIFYISKNFISNLLCKSGDAWVKYLTAA